mgnify:CR=1 FL=1
MSGAEQGSRKESEEDREENLCLQTTDKRGT